MPQYLNETDGEMEQVSSSHEALSLGECDGRHDTWRCPDCRTTWRRRCNRDKKNGVHPLPPMEGGHVKDATYTLTVVGTPGRDVLVDVVMKILLMGEERRQREKEYHKAEGKDQPVGDGPEPQPLAGPRTQPRGGRARRKQQ